MKSKRLTVRCIPFTREALQSEICRASFAEEGSYPCDQVCYLGSYLSHRESGAKTIIVETPYVDRHYLEEYSQYYATTLRPPRPKATRLHFFKNAISTRQFSYVLKQAANGNFDGACQKLNEAYLGFSVVRPLPDAPIGRTVLSTFNNDNLNRCYTLPPHPYRVHLCGLKLKVCGVPFQQQEQAVGACATTAVWSALAQVMRHDGGRAPTPFAVTEAATKHWVKDRVFPATSGLIDEQILEAIRQFGYSPHFFECKKKEGQDALFMMAVKCYLRSGIPVILKIHSPGDADAHAVTVVGFREDDEELVPDIAHKEKSWRTLCLRAKGMFRLYVHDDRLGAYARAEWQMEANKFIQFNFKPHEAGFEKYKEKVDVMAAIIPVYPKIRLSAQDLVGYAGQLLPLFKGLVGPGKQNNLYIDLRFAQTGECLEQLFHSGLPADKLSSFAKQAVLSRYVGMITFLIDDEPLAIILCDSTDIRRTAPAPAPLLAMLLYPPYDQHSDVLKNNLPGALIF